MLLSLQVVVVEQILKVCRWGKKKIDGKRQKDLELIHLFPTILLSLDQLKLLKFCLVAIFIHIC